MSHGTKCSQAAINWEAPLVTYGQADINMKYSVSIRSSATNTVNEFNVNHDQFMVLPQDLLVSDVGTYTICVSSVNCAGASEPLCTKAVLGKSPFIL